MIEPGELHGEWRGSGEVTPTKRERLPNNARSERDGREHMADSGTSSRPQVGNLIWPH